MTHAKTTALHTDTQWWADRHQGARPDAGLPLFRRRSKVYRRKSKRIVQELPAGLRQQLVGDSNSPQRALTVFLAAVAGVLHRYAGSAVPERITVGCPTHPSDDRAADVLPVFVDVAPTTLFEDLLGSTEEALTQSRERAVPTAELTDALGLADITDRNPLFSVALRTCAADTDIPDLQHDVTVTVTPGRALEIEYNAHTLEEATVERFGHHLVRFLESGYTRPRQVVSDLDYLTDDERAEILEVWSGGPGGTADSRSLHDLVASVVHEHGDRDAVVCGDLTLSYIELWRRAAQLAHHLRSSGVGSESRVGLCVPASAELLVGVLGILLSGAAVVPVVPTFPVPRNRMVIEDAAMDVAVTHTSLTHIFADTGLDLVLVDAHADEIATWPDNDPQAGATADDLAYLMFTSGSTGRPKGVAMEHRTLVNLVLWQRNRGLDPAGQRTLQRTSIGFDVSFQEIFSTWAFGGCLVVAPDDVRDDVSLLPGFVERHSIARLFLPPVALDQMAVTANVAQHTLTTLCEVIVAGEQLQISMPVRRFFHQLDCRLDNQYGPTETHVATAFALAGASTRWPEAPPIGTPVANVRIYVVDPWLRPVPAGVPGEILIGGVAPARGYLDEQATAERFLTDPFRSAGRLYRTGDRGRFLADGTVEYLGRQDDQVKIRGYRIELGEVETNLLRIPGVRQAAVTIHQSDALGKQLAAHVVTERAGEPDAARIRQQLLEHIPDHMVPATSAIVHAGSLPTTVTGKVDRNALPPLPQVTVKADHTATKGDTEGAVAQIWARALGLNQVGRDDSFIALGGHSLVGIQVVAQINELYSIALPLRSLLRGTTVAALADEIDALRTAGNGTPADRADAGSDPDQTPDLQELSLPDGRRVVCLHVPETRYLHLDVFEHRTYDRGGIRYPETGLVLDVGAHIGLFTLYALERSPGLEVHAFEPSPPLFAALRRNTEGLSNVRLFPFGLGAREDIADLTFYPNLTGMSSFHPDQHQERELLVGIIKNLSDQADEAGTLLAASDEYLEERLRARSFRAQRRTLSDVLAETNADRVSLLKIDVQKSEVEVLTGIADDDWGRIEQLAIELHDLDGQLDTVTTLLASKGYQLTVEQDSLHVGTAVHFIYAVRP
ncbi:amino acid adenylation domain-containing protein [Streptomyces sp. NPDC059970]|uniref:non-ribosomal peptide synthetase n=1 Tax=Streptomyces sp. NPDC059970 TaxID=3347019 RepID=UPI0036C8EA4F